MQSAGNDDYIPIIDEEKHSTGITAEPWRILVVDDDDDVHQATRYALSGKLKILGRPLELISAYSAAEAEKKLAHEHDIALILLDCVMETETAGLDLVERIRTALQLQNVRIVLRTGQPGYAPESEVIAKYDINDYHTKADLTRQRLITTITVALRSFQQLSLIHSSGILFQKIIAATADLMTRNTVADFCNGIMSHLNRFYSTPLEGFVVASFEGIADKITIQAATEKFTALNNSALSSINNVQAQDLIQMSFDSKQSLVKDNEAALVFDADDITLVAYIVAPGSFLEYEQNLLFLLSYNITMCADNLTHYDRTP